ncbi:hypothetical protein [Streptomyces sp. GC420]|uniref:hypothetical protein n=1 Tax=Streptomyces sp. GC420 TaxID=2697568 RepID=UPI001414F922|nr:hypothetical protein [Streptomyces sp. GC420]NBM19994.1 hypothetical protein [Streptomyces sp. GC420]
MATDPAHPVVVDKHAELRRCLDVGLARIEGRLALIDQRDTQSDKDLSGLAARVAALEHRRWPLPALAALSTVGALIAAVWQAFGN